MILGIVGESVFQTSFVGVAGRRVGSETGSVLIFGSETSFASIRVLHRITGLPALLLKESKLASWIKYHAIAVDSGQICFGVREVCRGHGLRR